VLIWKFSRRKNCAADFGGRRPYSPRKYALKVYKYGGIGIVKKIALWGSFASIAGFGLALYFMVVDNGAPEAVVAITQGDSSPAIGSNAGTININNNTYNVKASEELPIDLREGVAYEKARESLLAKGWQVIAMHTWPNMSPACWSDLADEESCKFKEIDSCAGSGMGFCLMYFHDGKDKFLRIRTVGGPPPYAWVDTWGKTTTPPKIQVHEFN